MSTETTIETPIETETTTATAAEATQATTNEAPPKPRRPRGFAAMDPALVSEIARQGGRAAHAKGTAHEFTSDEARDAGRKGGRATHAKRRDVAGT